MPSVHVREFLERIDIGSGRERRPSEDIPRHKGNICKGDLVTNKPFSSSGRSVVGDRCSAGEMTFKHAQNAFELCRVTIDGGLDFLRVIVGEPIE